MDRLFFSHDGLTFSYLDAGGSGPVVIALHAHWMEAGTYASLAAALSPAWRVVSLEQRGHGQTDHPATYTREDYLGDLDALVAHLRVPEGERLVLLGNSLGGVNAYQWAARAAARRRQRVRAMIIEDIGATVDDPLRFSLAWEGTFPTRAALAERIGPRLAPYLEPSFRDVPGGARLAFSARELFASQEALVGDHWADWLATDCPTLLVGGTHSPVTKKEQLAEMARRRPTTRLCMLDAGHVVHVDQPTAFAEAVRAFLESVPA